MGQDEAVQEHLDLSRDFLASAQRDAEEGRFAPARFNLLPALELALKAALIARTGSTTWSTHNVHGPFGQHFRGRMDAGTLAKVNLLIQEYGRSRYTDWEEPSHDEMSEDVAFVARMIEETIPHLVSEGSA